MLPVLKVFQHSPMSHQGWRAAVSAIGRVLLETSPDQFQFVDSVLNARLLSGKHGTMPPFLTTLNLVFQR